MKTILTIICLILVNSASFANTRKDTSFTLIGTVTGIQDGTEVKLEDQNTGVQVTAGKFAGGKFTLKGKLMEPTLCWLKIAGEEPQYIYVEHKTITVSAVKPVKSQNFKVSGSTSHTDFADFQTKFNPLISRLQAIVPSINSAPYGPERDSMMNVYNGILGEVQNAIDEYVDLHKKSFVTPFVLFVTTQFYEDPVKLENRFGKLDATVKETPTSKNLKAYIEYNKVGAVGTTALDFTQPDTTGTPVSLSSFKGKYVLVDFWASWCGPCRQENPNVVANFNKFKTKNFTVLGVSLDRMGQKENWLAAIHKDKLTWTHVSDLQFWDNAAAKLYRVQGIPYNFLVDPQGKIIGKNLRGAELESKLCEVLGCETAAPKPFKP